MANIELGLDFGKLVLSRRVQQGVDKDLAEAHAMTQAEGDFLGEIDKLLAGTEPKPLPRSKTVYKAPHKP